MSWRFCVSCPTTVAPADSTSPRISSHGSVSFGHGRSGSATLICIAVSPATENCSRWVSNALLMVTSSGAVRAAHIVRQEIGHKKAQGAQKKTEDQDERVSSK